MALLKGKEVRSLAEQSERQKSSGLDDRAEWLRELVDTGAFVDEIAEAVECSASYIFKMLKHYGVTFGRRDRRSRKITDDQIVALHKLGLTTSQAAQRLGVQYQTVRFRAELLGLTFRRARAPTRARIPFSPTVSGKSFEQMDALEQMQHMARSESAAMKASWGVG